MVAHGGFEPPISALRGRCPRPLDECATSDLLIVIGAMRTCQLESMNIRFVYNSVYSSGLNLYRSS